MLHFFPIKFPAASVHGHVCAKIFMNNANFLSSAVRRALFQLLLLCKIFVFDLQQLLDMSEGMILRAILTFMALQLFA